MKSKTSKQVIHERALGKHRILIIDGPTQQTGPWADISQLAELGGYHACAELNYRGLPVGVFRIAHVQHQVLS